MDKPSTPTPYDSETLSRLLDVAKTACQKAMEIIRDSFSQEIKPQHKDAGSTKAAQVVTETDLKCQSAILKILQPLTNVFDLGILTEESPDDHSRFGKTAFWCIDPLDGTLPYIEKRPGFMVSIALNAQNGTPLLGCVGNPLDGKLYFGHKGMSEIQSEQLENWEDRGWLVEQLTLNQKQNRNQISWLERPTHNQESKNVSEHKDGGVTTDANTDQTSKANVVSGAVSDAVLDANSVPNSKILQVFPPFNDPKQMQSFQSTIEDFCVKQSYDGYQILNNGGAVWNALQAILLPDTLFIKYPKKEQGGGCLWDYSATACLAELSGAWVSDIAGKPLDLNAKESLYLNHCGVVYCGGGVLASCFLEIV